MSGKRWQLAYLELTGEFLTLATTHLNLVRDYADFKDEHRALERAHDNLAAELAKRDESGPIVVTDEMVAAALKITHPIVRDPANWPQFTLETRMALTAALEAGRS